MLLNGKGIFVLLVFETFDQGLEICAMVEGSITPKKYSFISFQIFDLHKLTTSRRKMLVLMCPRVVLYP